MIAWARSCVDFGKEGTSEVCAAQNFAAKNFTEKKFASQNSAAQNYGCEQSATQNSTDRNFVSENSAEFDAACRNSVKANFASAKFNGENSVKFNCASKGKSSTDKNSTRKDLDAQNSASQNFIEQNLTAQNLDCEKHCVQDSACEKLIAQNSSCEQSAPQNSSCEKHAVRPESSAARDLLELYCGHGNFTIPLADKFNRVLASEISKSSIANARINCELNGVCNAQFVRLSADELMSAFARRREFERLKGIDIFSYDFSHVLIDPPRAGLEPSVIDFIKNFQNLIYISCNPQTLFENLRSLCATHEVRRFAIFDQFAHTSHIECGVLLRRRS
ncbi:methyltransferase domain-containing protein [uncultured Campylobacter sp.]|uniref:methyltransferase domain-containing protein n=1 Tax=uncultured Campylobacter sp. TaxID=218934 RepID=UPI00262FC8EF|nr:methyltransferase domain-containing protein [uncultured Campylobacter sp.]